MSDFKFSCPHCGQHIQSDTGYAGMEIDCPACAGRMTVPQPAGAAATLPPQISSAAPPPPRTSYPSVPAPVRQQTLPQPQRPAPKRPRGKDGWATDETGVNKIGTYIVGIGAIGAALLSWGMFGLQVSPVILTVVVSVCGLAGGALNVMGRGPIWAGMLTGLVLSLGAYGAVYLWILNREKVRVYEIAIAFTIGAVPGILLQKGLQKLLQKFSPAA